MEKKRETVIDLILRLGVFGTFLGHGIFALQVKQGWIKYFLAVGISEPTATTLLPLIGIMDLTVALVTLFKPLRIVLCWAVLWALITALIRPVSGEPVWDFVERAANFMAPLALLALHGFPKTIKELWQNKKE
ncbi:hypothetical protein HYS47_00550 [Candidatus Woesearchaeota archaeon]|nr:hypothetical protein [Candidatus Woesearchaeota archaeon]